MSQRQASAGPASTRIRERLSREGRLTFAACMAEALYGPDGYYTRRPRLGGADADFFTSPELHPVFGALLGSAAGRVWHALGRPDRFDIAEHGPGTGALCRDLLDWAHRESPAFAASIAYRLVETSDALRNAQRATLTSAGLLSDRVTWHEPISPGSVPGCGADGVRSIVGLILANELVDALPVHLVTRRDGRLLERYVVLDGDTLGWQDDAPSTDALPAYFERLGVWPGEGASAEVNLEGVGWLERAANTLDRGALLLLDYGYPASDLYSATRRYGTLLTYRDHTLGSDPLRHLGDQDITSHVDFTSLARAGERGGLETVGLISQASLLRRLGLDAYIRQLDRSPVSAADHDANRRAMQALIEPDGLGKVQGLLQTRGLGSFDLCSDDAAGAAPGDVTVSPWLPLLRPGQMRLPGPLDAEGFVDLEGQWQELCEGDDS